MSTLKKYVFPSAAYLLPALALAQTVNVNTGQLSQVEQIIRDIFNVVAPILLVLIILYILWGAFRFATAGGDEEQLESGKSIMLYGAIGLIIIGSLLGLISWIISLVSVSGGGTPNAPTI